MLGPPQHGLEALVTWHAVPVAGLQAVNGILIPGGAQNLRPGEPFFDVVSQLYDLAIEANDKGEYFPVSSTSGVRGLGMF